MGKLGISIYPNVSKDINKDIDYMELAHRHGFKRIFMNLLEFEGDKEKALAEFKDTIKIANYLGMEVMADVAPQVFKDLGIDPLDLSFFNELGVYGIRLDNGFTGQEEAKMTRNEYGLKVEINMSQGTNYVDQIMAFNPNTNNLIGSHNFYPHRYTGLGYTHFKECSEKFRKYNLNTMAFVNSQDATFGPWPVSEGLCTLEDHRNLPIDTQVKHLMLTGLIDDIVIANAYASEEELISMAKAFNSPYPILKVDTKENISELEAEVLFDNLHSYRGDKSEYMLRSTMTRVIYKGEDFYPHNCFNIERGDVLIDNNRYTKYAGETQIALKPMLNEGKVNVVGRISDDEMFLLDYIKPWSNFKLERSNKLF